MPVGYNANVGLGQNQIMNQNQVINQNVQPLFPQPQGNVYTINSTLEMSNVPVGAGISVALCLPENVMFIKTMQNGNPLFYPYRILPYTSEEQSTPCAGGTSDQTISLDSISKQLKEHEDKLVSLNEKISNIVKKETKGGFDI